MEYTEGSPTPDCFRLWSAIGALSAAMERRVWVVTNRGPQFANLYILLVSPPGVGKTVAISPAQRLLQRAGKFVAAPDNVTGASLVDALNAAKKIITRPDGKGVIEYSCFYIFADELGVFMSSHDLSFLSLLTKFYDNPDSYRETRRHSLKEPIDIINPTVTFLAGTQPGFLSAVLPEVAWTQGLTGRLIMIYANKCPNLSIFEKYDPREALEKRLVAGLAKIANLYGQCSWANDAVEEFVNWEAAGFTPVPDHPKLEYYCNRRGRLFAVRLAMISAISRGSDFVIGKEDVIRAKSWLLEAEASMPFIFRDMVYRSDVDVINEVLSYVLREYATSRKPVHESVILSFLQKKTLADKADKILSLMERSGQLVRYAGTETYVPKPKAFDAPV